MRASGATLDPTLEVESEPDDGEPLGGGDPQRHEVVPDLGADGDERVAGRAEPALDPRYAAVRTGPK